MPEFKNGLCSLVSSVLVCPDEWSLGFLHSKRRAKFKPFVFKKATSGQEAKEVNLRRSRGKMARTRLPQSAWRFRDTRSTYLAFYASVKYVHTLHSTQRSTRHQQVIVHSAASAQRTSLSCQQIPLSSILICALSECDTTNLLTKTAVLEEGQTAL